MFNFIDRFFQRFRQKQCPSTGTAETTANAASEAERRRYHNIIEGTNAGTWDWDIVTGELIINKRWAEIIGYTLEELSPITIETWRDRVHPSDIEEAMNLLEAHFQRELDYYDVQFRQKHKDGTWRWIHARGRVIQWSEDKKPLQMSGIHLEITEHQLAQDRLAESQQMLQHILETIPTRVFWKDLEGRFLGANKLVAQDLGLTHIDEILGKTDYDFGTKETADQYREEDLKIIKEGEVKFHEEGAHIYKDDTIAWLRSSKAPLTDRHGNTIGIIGTYENTTESKRVREELIKAKEIAENANKARDDFMAVMSHEMRTPLNPIIGYAEILRDSITNEQELSYIDAISLSADRQLKLIDDILDYMRISNGNVEVNPEIVDLIKLCEAVTQDAQIVKPDLPVLFENGGLNAIAVPSETHVEADLTILRRILDNLINNACKYTQHGTITLNLSAHLERADTFCFEIRDTGIGIPPETLEILFEPFSQADSTYTRTHQGVGLGLAICHKLCSLLGAKLSVKSEVGIGSTLTMEVSLKQIEKQNRDEQQDDQNTSVDFTFSKSLNVLIVEDAEENARVAKAMIKRFSGRSTIVINGKLAVEICEREQFDLILMDISMPVMNGIEATQIIRRESTLNKGTPIIAVTADVTPQTKKQCQDVGMDGYVSKPVRKIELYNAIQTAIS
ncbi:MAG: ATP-binding protein [Opitutaceae bacterium]